MTVVAIILLILVGVSLSCAGNRLGALIMKKKDRLRNCLLSVVLLLTGWFFLYTAFSLEI